MIAHDPIEDTLQYKQVQAEVDALAEQCVPAYIRYGRCDAVWQEKKRILKEVYDMDWKTPQEMNPNWDFI